MTPTPHSDQAETTPDVLKLLSDFTNKHYAMAADEHCEGYPGPSVRKRYDASIAAEYALIEAIRAQNAELLALRAALDATRANDSAGLYFLAKLDAREIWTKHLGPHKCDVDGVDKFLAELEAWMMAE